MLKKELFCFVAALCFSTAAVAETAVSQDAVKSLNVTVYNNGLGLVKDTRTVDFFKGKNTVSFLGVSAEIQPETALFDGKGLKTLEQNFNFDLISRQSLLKKYLGKNVQVFNVNPGNGKETIETAKVVSVNAGLVLKIGDRIEADYTGRVVFPDVPADLHDQPTLTADLVAADDGRRDVRLSYLTNGLTWRADYVAELNDKEDALNLNGWVTLTNTSGVAYKNADMQFVAGSVNRVRSAPRPMMMAKSRGMMLTNAMETGSMAEEQLMDYHLYSLGRKTDVMSGQTKQLALLSADNIKVQKEYKLSDIVPAYRSGKGGNSEYPSRAAAVTLRFDNDKASRLGMALPAGVVRVYKAAAGQRLFFVGEDKISHTPENEKVKLILGEAFDVTASGKETAFSSFAANSYEASYEIEFKNAKDEPVTVLYAQNFQQEWNLSDVSHAFKKTNASQAEWTIAVPAKGKTVLTYTVRVRRP